MDSRNLITDGSEMARSKFARFQMLPVSEPAGPEVKRQTLNPDSNPDILPAVA